MNTQFERQVQHHLDTHDTPYLLIDKDKFLANVNSLKQRCSRYHVTLRPHLKTVRSLEAAQHILETTDAPATVSTLAEAEAFAQAGYTNLLYAVGIAPSKLDRIAQLRARGTDISVLLDSIEQAKMVSEYCNTHHCEIPALIEIDCDDVRAGIRSDDPLLLDIATSLNQYQGLLRGVLTHAGGSYQCKNPEALQVMAQQEIDAVVAAANKLKQRGFQCEMISVGSTPTAYFAANFDGVTEVRAGVYHFFDVVMADIGVCSLDDIALSVVTSVIGHNTRKQWLLIDAGWMALSSDSGNDSIPGYGVVIDQHGTIYPNLRVLKLSQEHGIITDINGDPVPFDTFPIGSRMRILPNHACSMAAMHTQYIVESQHSTQSDIWPRIVGW
jgi:D-serine deaminase-like pyridoxal phosphate-dependent protein